MTEQTGASAPESASSSSPAQGASLIEKAKASQASSLVAGQSSNAPAPVQSEVEKDILTIYQRLQNLEARLVEDFSPKIESLIQAFEGLAARAEADIPASLATEVAELRSALHAFASTQFAHDTTAHLHSFKSWWQKFLAPSDPAPVANTLSAGGASVTNEVKQS